MTILIINVLTYGDQRMDIGGWESAYGYRRIGDIRTIFRRIYSRKLKIWSSSDDAI